MLVVVGIIGVLISMLIPSLKRTMQLAASTVCMHNLREIGHGLMLYRVENDGWLPTNLATKEEESATASSRSDTWFMKLIPTYLADPMVMACPKDPYRFRMVEALRGWRIPADIGDYASYGINSFMMTSAGGMLADLDRHRPSRPLDTILVADLGPDTVRGVSGPRWASGPRRKGSFLMFDDGYDPLSVYNTAPWVTRRHGHGINMATADGSVRPVRTNDVMRKQIRTYYKDCAAGGCSLCNINDPSKPFIFHYSFAQDRLFWWTGPVSLE